MIFKELRLYFKKYKVITVMIYLQVTLILLLLGSFLYFIDSLKYEENGLKETYEGKALYQLIDNYVNEDEEILMNSDNSLEIVKNYYNNLNSSKNFQYLNINNQAIGLINHDIDDIFKYGYELGQIPETNNNNITPIKSIQINRQAFDFFKIDVSDGVSFSQDDFKFNDNFIPVILGNSYKDIYKVGDILPIEYYLTKFNAKVIGFAKSDSKVLLNGNMDEYLDRYKDKIIAFDGFGEKSYSNMINSIEKSRHVKLANFIYALGIPDIGFSRAKLICNHFNNDFNKISNLTYEELSNISGVGDVIAKEWIDTFSNPDFIEELKELKEEIDIPKASTNSNKGLDGLTFVITGSLNKFTNRDTMIEFIEEHGGKVVTSISSKVNYLINNDITSTSTKNNKAKELGINIIDEDKFLELIKEK